ncbi:MAG: hypothetical protein DME10_13950 [Candidatus Rokuibacteriota bacterium]|nr:MAG: hypothetical protein DME10_13950 [Candidatus Rokubacteria bacterium]
MPRSTSRPSASWNTRPPSTVVRAWCASAAASSIPAGRAAPSPPLTSAGSSSPRRPSTSSSASASCSGSRIYPKIRASRVTKGAPRTWLHSSPWSRPGSRLDSTGDPAFCSLWTLCGMPAISVPLMQGENGLPLGLQMVGPRHGDARLLRTARWLVEHLAKG